MRCSWREAALDLGLVRGQLDHDHLAAGGGDLGEKFVDGALRHGVLRIEGEDDTRRAVHQRAAEGGEPDLLAQRDEARRAEIVERERHIHREMIVEKPPAGAGGDLARDGEFAHRRRAVEEEQFHGVA